MDYITNHTHLKNRYETYRNSRHPSQSTSLMSYLIHVYDKKKDTKR